MLNELLEAVVGTYNHMARKMPSLWYNQDRERGLCITPRRQILTYNCGMVALITVIEFFRPRSNFTPIVDGMKDLEDGAHRGYLIKYLRKYKISYKYHDRLSINQIKKEIDAGHPIITTTNHSGGHWCVIYGYTKNYVHVAGCWKTRYVWEDFRSNLEGGKDENLVIIGRR